MGNTKQSLPKLQKFDVEILLDKIYQHMLIQRDRKINELAQKEIAQRELMSQKLCSYEEVSFEFLSIVGIFNYVQAVKIIMRYCKSLKDYSIRICKAQQKNDFDEIEDLQQYIEGIIWSAEKLNLSYIKEFNNMIYKYFGAEVYQRLRRYNNLDAQLRSLFSNIEPTTREIQSYLTKFLQRYRLKMKDFPEGGQGNNDGNNFGQGGGKKDDFMDQINNLKFNQDNNSNKQQKQEYQDIPLNDNNSYNNYPQYNNQNSKGFENFNNQNNQGFGDYNNQKPNDNFMQPQDVQYPAFDNQEIPEYKPQYQQDNKGNKNDNDDNFDDMINQLDEDNGISGVKKDLQKRQSAMDEQSDFVTKEVLPTHNQNNQQKNLTIGKKINQNDLDYDATKYYINSLIGKDNDYKIDLGDSMRPDEKN